MAAPVLILLSIVIPSVTCFESKISVTCDDVPQHITVTLNTDTAFWGHLYASGNFNHPNCSVQGQGDRNLTLSIPFNSCDTTVDDKGIYLNKVTVQQHPTIVSSGDGQYNVACKMFVPNLNVETKSGMDVLGLPVDAFRPVNDSNLSSKSNSSLPQPKIILRVYDYQNDVFVDTVRLGQVVELEVTIRDGNLYKGRVSDCDAFGGIDGKTIPVIRNFCPVDQSVSDKVYVDDQSRMTSDFYLYIPFKVFRFLDGRRVSFTCNVIVCADPEDCPQADCGNFTGMSYGRRRRSVKDLMSGTMFQVKNELTVVDDATTHMQLQESYGLQEHSDAHVVIGETKEYEKETYSLYKNENIIGSLGGILIAVVLALSLALNGFFLIKRHSQNATQSKKHTIPNEQLIMQYDTKGICVSR